ncbi:MAG: glutamate synthase subunit beta, partial [Acutalibacteraceae bacterium]
QASRCMNCGVPFCQSGMVLNGMKTGCPLHNLIPEWNDQVYKGNWDQALSRLLKTNNFPEFTGRVCPALCECACTCNIDTDAVSVHDNELEIIERGYENGLITPNIPKVRTDKKVAVIGSGPSGLAVADQLNKRGHNVTVFERDDRIGGLLMYGIPNMKLDKRVIDRKINLMTEEGVEFKTNSPIDSSKKANDLLKKYDAVVLCCGSRKPRDINAVGRDAKGVYFAVDFLTAVTKSLLNSDLQDKKYPDAKNKNVVIVGGGDTGNDCVGTSIRLGCKSVTQLEIMPKLPDTRAENNPWPEYPRVCKTDYGQQEAIAKFGSDPRLYQTTVKELIKDKDGNLTSIVTVDLEFVKNEETGRMDMKEVKGSEKTLACELLLIAAGFIGCEDSLSKAFSVDLTNRNTISTNNYSTSVEKVFSAGDVRTGQSLVVSSIADGRACAKEVDKFLMGYTNMIN